MFASNNIFLLSKLNILISKFAMTIKHFSPFFYYFLTLFVCLNFVSSGREKFEGLFGRKQNKKEKTSFRSKSSWKAKISDNKKRIYIF